jgi:orotidine-5'-phosphate decarboxylase
VPAPFGDRLAALTARRGPLCVGIDPHPGLLAAWGLPDDVSGLERFAYTVAEALAGEVAVLKPQAAFFERFGSRGVAVLEAVLARIRDGGALSIVDAKRGDIGSTMEAYAAAFVGDDSPLAGDAVTASPYLGFGSLRPMLDLAAATGRGVFVLAFTSNPEGPRVQQALGSSGRSVGQSVIDAAAVENRGRSPQGSVGVVVGATLSTSDPLPDLAGLNGPILAPGLGAQGATAEDLRSVFGAALGNVLPSSSRDVLRAGPSVAALRTAAERAVEAVLGTLDGATR